MFNCVRSSILANSVEIFADVHICFVPDNFYFLIFEKHNSKIGELSSRKLHSGTFHCPGMDLAGTRDISFHSGTVPGNPGHLVTLMHRAVALSAPHLHATANIRGCCEVLSSIYSSTKEERGDQHPSIAESEQLNFAPQLKQLWH